MKTRSIAIGVLVLASIIAFALSAPVQAQYIWKVNIHGSKFYLVGSIHVGKPELYPLPDVYKKAYDVSPVVMMELEEDFDSLSEMIFKYGEKYRLNEEQYLDKKLDAESLQYLQKIFTGHEDLLTRYYKYNAWMLNMAIAGRKYTLIGYDPELAIDKHFSDLAHSDGKKIIGLDRLESQLQIFEFDLPEETGLRLIKSSITGAKSQAEAERALLDGYYSYNIERFGAAFLDLYDFENERVRQVYDMIFTDRNEAWVKKMKELASGEPTTYFMMVGCGHFFGLNNVRSLLERQGYKVEYVPEAGL